MKPPEDLGVTTIALQPTEGTSHLPFGYSGIPEFQFIRDPSDYLANLIFPKVIGFLAHREKLK
jgi:hypothetical protein